MLTSAPFWFRWISFNVNPAMAFAEQAKICTTNASAMAMVVCGAIFGGFNWVDGRAALVPFNLTLAAVGFAGLFLAIRRQISAAFLVVTIGASVVFIVTGWMYRNGAENFLLTVMAGAVFVLEVKAIRWGALVLYGTAFVVVKLSHFDSYEQDLVSRSLYTANLVIFLIGLTWFLELFRQINGDSLRVIAAKNQDLERDQEKLVAQSVELIAVTRLKERLFSVVAHDLRGPVGALRLSLEMFEGGQLPPEDFRMALRDLRIGTANVHECLEGLLVWAQGMLKDTEPEIRSLSLLDEVLPAVRLLTALADLKGISIDNRVTTEVRVEADANRLRTVLRNLISNAVKYSQEGGEPVVVDARREGVDWLISVNDRGAGMSEERLQEVLRGELDHSVAGTTNEQGVGLGIQLCREFLKEIGSDLEILSRPGEGTTVAFRLPCGGV